jgi:hypothetical protein
VEGEVIGGLRAIILVTSLGLGGCVGAVKAIAPPYELGVVVVPDGVAIGTAHPFKLIDVDPGGRWVALCQAREDTDGDGKIVVAEGWHGPRGDVMRPYLALGPGPGLAVDDLIGADRSGEHIVLIRDARLLVHHVSLGRTEVLAARRRDVAEDMDHEHRAATLDRERGRLAYHVRRRHGTDVIVRDLSTGGEIVFRVPGLVYRADFSASGHWILLGVVTTDTNGDGKPGLSTWTVPRGAWTCRGTPEMGQRYAEVSGDDPELYVAPITGGRPRKVEGLIHPIGARLLVRESDGAISAEGADRERNEWVPAACEGRVIGHSVALQRVLVGCMQGDRMAPAPAEIHGPGFHHQLRGSMKADQLGRDVEREWARFADYVAVDGVYVVDLVTAQEWRVPDGYQLDHVNEAGAVLSDGDGHLQWNLPAGTTTSDRSSVRVRFANVLFEARDGRVLGAVDGTQGLVLFSGWALPVGPLAWLTIGR